MHLWFGLSPGFSPWTSTLYSLFFPLFPLLYPGLKSETSFGVSPTHSLCVDINSLSNLDHVLPLPVKVDPSSYMAFCDGTWSSLQPHLTSTILTSLTLAMLRGWAWASLQSSALALPTTRCFRRMSTQLIFSFPPGLCFQVLPPTPSLPRVFISRSSAAGGGNLCLIYFLPCISRT